MQAHRWQEKESQLETVFSAEASGVGEVLRRERILRQDSLELIADRLKIRTIFLDAIERQAYEELPGEPYATGFIRDWSKLYGLDVMALTQQFKDETHHLQPLEYNVPQVIPEQTQSFRWPILAGSAIFIILLSVGWHWWGGGSQENHQVVENESASQPEESSATKQVNAQYKNQELADFKEAANQKIDPDPTSIPQTSSSPHTPVATQTTPNAILFQATGPCWIEIKNHSTGNVIVSQLLKEGDTYEVPAEKDLTAKIGNPSALKITVGEVAITSVSTSSQPITIDLDADSLLSKQ